MFGWFRRKKQEKPSHLLSERVEQRPVAPPPGPRPEQQRMTTEAREAQMRRVRESEAAQRRARESREQQRLRDEDIQTLNALNMYNATDPYMGALDGPRDTGSDSDASDSSDSSSYDSGSSDSGYSSGSDSGYSSGSDSGGFDAGGSDSSSF